ncbi:hypothetical protein [Dyella sp. 2HG41-7]|uniref:hypothetical protein n=1 Tax=Dyella sp. 2HG41-7 TaxID=2883239 RepID=UPI001F37EC24|nr:hypothetical protein [Dyella sp. 2HG41-7]
MSEPQHATLLKTGRTYWRAFALAWIFPVVFLFGGLEADQLGYPTVFFFALLPLFFWSLNRAGRPWMRREISYWHAIFWCLAVPFMVWALAVFVHLAVSGH